MNSIDLLNQIFQTNNKLITFAETKNAVLIAFNFTVIISLAFLLGQDLGNFPDWILIYIMAFNVISALIALSSLVAQKQSNERSMESTTDDNLFFFGTISRIEPEEYLRRLLAKYQMQSVNHALELDLSRQLVIITQIARRKFTRFNNAMAFTIMAIITPVGYLIYYYLFHPNR
jgi:hypothetical protein